MVVTGFVIADSLKEARKNIVGKVLNTVQFKRAVLSPKVEKSVVITKAWFGRFCCKRHDQVWRWRFPYLAPEGDGA